MTLRFLLVEGISSVRRVAAASMIGAFVIGVALAIVGGLVLVAIAYRSELNMARASAAVEVFLDDDIALPRARMIADEITSFPSVSAARVRSREEAAELFDMNRTVDTAAARELLPLPLTIQVELEQDAQDIVSMQAVREDLSGIVGVEDVAFPGELVAIVDSRSRLFFRIALSIGVALTLAVLGIMATTAQLAVVSRRSVIRTMWLLGAERRWVLAPFVIQGMIIGMAGGTLATLIQYLSWLLFPGIESLLESSGLRYLPLVFPVVGLILGGLGSAAASGYYTREVERPLEARRAAP
jgi:cell division transport system permease protein